MKKEGGSKNERMVDQEEGGGEYHRRGDVLALKPEGVGGNGGVGGGGDASGHPPHSHGIQEPAAGGAAVGGVLRDRRGRRGPRLFEPGI